MTLNNSDVARQTVVLDFDHSAGRHTDDLCLDLSQWQEKIRFGCSWSEFNQLADYITPKLTHIHTGCVLLGSGDYHHLSYLLLKQCPENQPIHLVICDNHPDNMRYPFGIHCGSWVYWASRLPQVSRIDVIGIGSSDISLKHAWENHWSPLFRGKLHYWSIEQSAAWTRWIGAGQSWHGYADANHLMTDFLAELQKGTADVYLSIDKDVLSKSVVMTNWDQGYFLEHHLHDLIDTCRQRLVAADITGDISAYTYKKWFKRFLSASDGQDELTDEQIQSWQVQQQQLNQRLIARINQAWKTA